MILETMVGPEHQLGEVVRLDKVLLLSVLGTYHSVLKYLGPFEPLNITWDHATSKFYFYSVNFFWSDQFSLFLHFREALKRYVIVHI